jgi:hypothetical protein
VTIDTISAESSKQFLDLLIQIGALMGFAFAGIGAVIRYSSRQTNKKIDDKLKPLEDKVDKLAANLHTHSMDLNKRMDKVDNDNEEIGDKVNKNLVEATDFMASTEARLSNIEKGKTVPSRRKHAV